MKIQLVLTQKADEANGDNVTLRLDEKLETLPITGRQIDSLFDASTVLPVILIFRRDHFYEYP
ncbi:MAG: hypothetical protein U5R30_08310 [Deltaproteobacteria bacterium]|nr:hypothetical protein [Deltaproteobacteria bacterium]